jgi:hypothetical protein
LAFLVGAWSSPGIVEAVVMGSSPSRCGRQTA